MCEVGIEEVLVWRKYSSSFLGEIGTPPRWYPPYPAAHSGGLGLTGGEYMGYMAPHTSPHLPSLHTLQESFPGILAFLAWFPAATSTDPLEPWCPLVIKAIHGSYSWIPRALLARQVAVT